MGMVSKVVEKIRCRWPVDEARIHDESPGRAPSRVFRALETALSADDVKTVAEIIEEHPDALLEVNQYGCQPMTMGGRLWATWRTRERRGRWRPCCRMRIR